MKKIFFAALVISSVMSQAQILRMGEIPNSDNILSNRLMDPYASSNGGVLNQRGEMYLNQAGTPGAGRTLSYSDIQGNAYYSKDFVTTKFEGVTEPAPGRYNTYLDEVEFKKEKNDDKVYVLPKNDMFSRITFLDSKDTLVKLDTGDDLSGYFFEIVAGQQYGLYKKMKTTFINGTVSDNAYSNNTPPSFKNLNPIYYIKTPSGFIKNPKNTKEIIEALPGQKDQLEGYLKSNKTKVNKQDDLAKLVNFLNGKSN
ncbi:hypothetical protein [Chryseobacterium pennipullorum]|uniref:GLPGLI family protein n=1 Tax=Chryseobacterium pennipullorum TaxID=2258963 RepID=A0A3D9B7N7_9FLAO|nr:hypothetical protein [Chryseobacterium pennipullorum]REC49162.1 hypothetical protein DRF67_06320 [Chryseobacterium pennipullorum]